MMAVYDSHKAWWKNAVVYQVYPRSFSDSDGDGIGDLRGLIQRIDYLSYLGIDVIWLSPVYLSPHDDNGYDISDYQKIDPIFGDLDDFDELLREAHSRGIKLVMDLVVNHTSDEHPWFVESRSGPDSAKRDWYWWRPPRTDEAGREGPPNNWGSFFAGSAWEYDKASGEYFLHLFSRKQPDLNWENPEVRQAIYRTMRWWLERGVDGFRMDVINFISKDPALPDAPSSDQSAFVVNESYYGKGPRIHEYLQEMHREVFEGRDATYLKIGETPGVSLEDARLYTDEARHELDMVFQFEHVQLDHGQSKWDVQPLDIVALKRSMTTWQHGLAREGWNSLYLGNHDQPRSVSRFGEPHQYREQSAKTLATILHLHRGTPFIYQGEELGMTNGDFASIDEFRDIESIRFFEEGTARGTDVETLLSMLRYIGRDNARTPMQWDDSRHAGFTAGTPWIAVNANHDRINVEASMQDPHSVLHHYRRLIELRHTDPLVVEGDFTLLLPDDPYLYAFTRTSDTAEMLVVGNFSVKPRRVDVLGDAAWTGAELVLGNLPVGTELSPWQSVVLRRHR